MFSASVYVMRIRRRSKEFLWQRGVGYTAIPSSKEIRGNYVHTKEAKKSRANPLTVEFSGRTALFGYVEPNVGIVPIRLGTRNCWYLVLANGSSSFYRETTRYFTGTNKTQHCSSFRGDSESSIRTILLRKRRIVLRSPTFCTRFYCMRRVPWRGQSRVRG